MYRKYKLTNKIRKYRIDSGLTLSGLAFSIGVSVNCILAYEKGDFSPSSYHALLLCKVFGVKFEDLFSLEVK